MEEKLKDLNQNIVMNEYELRDLEENLKKELHDVENLKKLSLSSFIYTIIGNKSLKSLPSIIIIEELSID